MWQYKSYYTMQILGRSKAAFFKKSNWQYCCCLYLCMLASSSFAQRPVNEIEITHMLSDTSRQRDLIDIGKAIFKIKAPQSPDSTGQKVYFSVLPFSTAVPGGGHALITSTTAGFYLGDREDTYMSRVTFTPYTNFGKRFGLPIRSYIWLKENKWVVDGDIRILKYPQNTWGLGRAHKDADGLLVDYAYLRFYQHFLKRISNGFFIGGGYNLDCRMGIDPKDDDTRLRDYTGYAYGTSPSQRTVSSGLSIDMIFDTRANSINPLDGNYANLQFRVNPQFLGSDQSWQSLYLELRRYHRFTTDPNKQHMLAVRNFFWTVFNSKAPYLDLPNIGSDIFNSSGRGFEQGRFRGKSLFYLETEYRRDISQDGFLGFVVFANANTVSGPKSTLFWNWNPGAGAGLRIKFNKNSGTNMGIDYAFSKHHSGIRLTLGEVF